MKCDYGCHNKLYRDPDNGKISGVCAGIADYYSWDVTLVRIVTVILAISFTFVTVALYIIGAVFLQPKPRNLYDDQDIEDVTVTITILSAQHLVSHPARVPQAGAEIA